MKCKKCGKELTAEDKFCPACGAKVKQPSRFSQKVEAENKAKAHQKKMSEKEEKRQKAIIEKRGLKNKYIPISFGFGLAGTALTLWPAGWENQLAWWYFSLTLLCGCLGYFFAMKANKLNKQYFQRYRVYVSPKLMKAGIYLSAFAVLGGVLLFMAFMSVNFPLE